MADISKIVLPSGPEEYNLKDATARRTFYCTCSTTSYDSDKVVACDDPDFVLEKGVIIIVYFNSSAVNYATDVTLNVNNTGAYPIIMHGATYTGNNWEFTGAANRMIAYIFNGVGWKPFATEGQEDIYYPIVQFTTGAVGIFPWGLVMETADGSFSSLVTSSSTSTSKTRNPNGFRLGGLILYSYGNTIEPNTQIDGSVPLYKGSLSYNRNMRYSFNCGTTLTAKEPLYLVGAVGTDGLFYLDTKWWSQELPTTEDGKVYIYIGYTASTYTAFIDYDHPMFWYKDGAVRPYSHYTDTTYTGTSPIDVTGTVISHDTSGVTAGNYGDTTAQTPAQGGTFKVPSLSVDSYGHVTAVGAHNVTIPGAHTLRDSYGRYRTGSHAIFADSLCVRTINGYMAALTTTGGADDTEKMPITDGFRPEKIYYSLAATNANTAISASNIYLHVASTNILNTFNTTPSTYSSIFLCGTYNPETGLFTLDNSSTTSWYKYQRYNAATASTFTAGKDYIRVGQNHSTAAYFQLEAVNTMYHFDGTNLVPWFGKETIYTGTSPITVSGKEISHANSGATAGSYGDSSAQSPAMGGTFKVPYVTVNATGHVTGISEHTVTMPSTVDTTYSSTTFNDVNGNSITVSKQGRRVHFDIGSSYTPTDELYLIATLPSGYRPAKTILKQVPVYAASWWGYIMCQVATTGLIIFGAPFDTSNNVKTDEFHAYFSMDFDTAS